MTFGMHSTKSVLGIDDMNDLMDLIDNRIESPISRFPITSEDRKEANLIEDLRSEIRYRSPRIRNTPVSLAAAVNFSVSLRKDYDFPDVTVEIAQNFEGEEYFVFKYNGRDIFGEAV